MSFFQILNALARGQVLTPDNLDFPNGSTVHLLSKYENFDDFVQLEQGKTFAGQGFSTWVIQTANGFLQDVCVRDNNKLAVVITSRIYPHDIQPLAKYLVEGFQQSFPDRNLKVLVYAANKSLILTANYNNATRRLDYQ